GGRGLVARACRHVVEEAVRGAKQDVPVADRWTGRDPAPRLVVIKLRPCGEREHTEGAAEVSEGHDLLASGPGDGGGGDYIRRPGRGDLRGSRRLVAPPQGARDRVEVGHADSVADNQVSAVERRGRQAFVRRASLGAEAGSPKLGAGRKVQRE